MWAAEELVRRATPSGETSVDDDEREAAVEAPLAPRRHRTPGGAKRARAHDVHDAERERGRDLQRGDLHGGGEHGVRIEG